MDNKNIIIINWLKGGSLKGFGGFGRDHRGFWGVYGIQGGLLYPYKTLFAPLEVLYGTRFGSKHHIMVQLAKHY